MTLDRLTQITSVGITSGITLNNATLTGVTTIASLDSVGVGGTITAVDGNFTGNVSIAGTLTYEDVTNIDSVGLVTARSGIHVTGGSVGIGTDNPSWGLDLQRDANTQARFIRNNAGDSYLRVNSHTGNIVGLQLGDNTDVDKQMIRADNTNNALIFNVANSEKLRINSSGNVGIGTDNPGHKLDLRVNTNDVTTGSPNSDSFLQIRGDDATVGNGPSLSLLNLGGTKETGWRISAVSTSGNNGDLVFNGYAGGATYPEAARFTSAGNLKFPSGQGIDFSATSDGSGTTTSELLDDYEEGTWTPTDVSGAGLSFSAAGGFYTKIGRLVTCFFYVTFPSTANTSPVAIGSLPFTTGNNVAGGVWTGAVAYNTYGSVALIGPSSVTSFNLGIPGGTDITNANMSLKVIRGSFSYYVA